MLMKLTPGDDIPLTLGAILRPPEPKPEPVSDAVKWVDPLPTESDPLQQAASSADMRHPSAPKFAKGHVQHAFREQIAEMIYGAPSDSLAVDHYKPYTPNEAPGYKIIHWGNSPEVTTVATQSMEYDIPGVGKVLVTGTPIISTLPAPTVSFEKVPGGLQYWISQPPAQVLGSWGDAPDDQYGA